MRASPIKFKLLVEITEIKKLNCLWVNTRSNHGTWMRIEPQTSDVIHNHRTCFATAAVQSYKAFKVRLLTKNSNHIWPLRVIWSALLKIIELLSSEARLFLKHFQTISVTNEFVLIKYSFHIFSFSQSTALDYCGIRPFWRQCLVTNHFGSTYKLTRYIQTKADVFNDALSLLTCEYKGNYC